MSFQFLINNVGCFQAADVWYIEGELLSGDLLKETTAIALTEAGKLPVFIRNVAFVDPPTASDRFFTAVIDKPDYDVEQLKGATLIVDQEGIEDGFDSLPAARIADPVHDLVVG
jgi:hypothetical protein